MDNEKIRDQVREEFVEYLTLHKHRKTAERYAILDHIYSTKGHFNMDSLYNSMMEEASFRVSRSTLYNTMELLIDCGLVVKHQFGANASQYERAYGNENHDHIICIDCGVVRESRSPLLSSTQLKKITKFTVSYYSMYIYGVCSKCSHARRMKLNRMRKK
ncbi:MAG: transcriptional repressor [Dysgonamonadaceae bacterium]|nr:transcriptional repressor [Dysgonamonadaceae bacterium]